MSKNYKEEKHRDDKFDPYVHLKGEHVEALMEHLTAECEKVETRTRKRKAKDRTNFKRTVETVVANAIRVWGSERDAIHYSRKAEGYTLKEYFPDWLGYIHLTKAIDILARYGFLETTCGDNSDELAVQYRKRPQSTFKATRLLLDLCRNYGLTSWSTEKSLDAPVLFLKDGLKRPKSFASSDPDLAGIERPVRQFNGFNREYSFELKQSWLEATDDESKLRRVDELDMNRTFLYRVFNNGSWHEGGRWFGGWWQDCPAVIRPYILINGEPTVELDYSGFLTRALYHQIGVDYQEQDPYDLPEVMKAADAQKLSKVVVRDSIKQLMNILINASDSDRVDRIPGLCLPRGYKLASTVYSLLKDKHKPIASYLRSGIGLRMMAKESEICRRILLEGMDKGVLVLPIHDSYIVQEKHKDWLWSAMHSHYREVFGFNPVVKEEKSVGQQADPITAPLEMGTDKSGLLSEDNKLTASPSKDTYIDIPLSTPLGEGISSLPLQSTPAALQPFFQEQNDRLWAKIAAGGPSKYDPMK